MKHFRFLYSFLLDCFNVTALFWSYITQTGRASSFTACWWQTTLSLWEEAFNSMCNQFDGQPLSWALMNTVPVLHTCFLFCLSVCRCSSTTSALEVLWAKQVLQSTRKHIICILFWTCQNQIVNWRLKTAVLSIGCCTIRWFAMHNDTKQTVKFQHEKIFSISLY